MHGLSSGRYVKIHRTRPLIKYEQPDACRLRLLHAGQYGSFLDGLMIAVLFNEAISMRDQDDCFIPDLYQSQAGVSQ